MIYKFDKFFEKNTTPSVNDYKNAAMVYQRQRSLEYLEKSLNYWNLFFLFFKIIICIPFSFFLDRKSVV